MYNSYIINASPLIFLSRAGEIKLLQCISQEIIVPEAVANEIHKKGIDDPTVQTLIHTPWLKIQSVSICPIIQAWDLGDGESSVLSLAKTQTKALIIIDDLAARRCAETFNMNVIGTLGIILIAKKHKKISLARPIIEKLKLSGMYLSPRVIDQALALVEE